MSEVKPLKVVHFSTTDFGGAYRAAERINVSMRAAGVDSQLVVRTKTRQNTDCIEYFKSDFGRFVSKVKNVGNLLLSSGLLVTDFFGTDISKSVYVKEADIVVLHWVNSFISYGGVKKLIETGKKVVWVMHDEWIYTEGVHCAYERQSVNAIADKILGKLNIHLKKIVYSGAGISFVAVSNWIREQALKSDILRGEHIVVINNPLDTSVFKPCDQDANNPYRTENRKIVLFGADKATNNMNKGYNYLVDALKKLDGKEYSAVCFGESPEGTRIKLDNIDIIYTGMITDDEVLINLYNLADVMVVPSIQEAFGYTCCEALACGTPVVGFDTSGLKDQIIHKENGYLAKPGDPDDLTEGIRYCIREHDRLSLKARETAVERNSYPFIGKRYVDLFDEITGS